MKNNFKEEDYQFIKYALEYSSDAHKGQSRMSGEPYIDHPMRVAEILADLGMDAMTIASALLHDVLEDTTCTQDELKRKFGEEICLLVSGVTKLSKIKFLSQEEEQAENYRKMFFAIAQDVRVLFIKLADRLHNMRTLGALPPEKQLRIARETLDLYAPLAGRLGIANIKSELEDLAMKYLYPEDYNNIVKSVASKMGERMGFVMRIANEIEIQLTELGIKGEVKGRQKHYYSIFKKMKNQNKSIDQIYDLIAVRVVVDTVRECYTVLGIIHSKWKPIPGRFKDYIAMPKPNLYQSLHTTVITNFEQIFEIQIRTHEMNRIAEYGIAAHWKYKEGKFDKQLSEFDAKLGWIKEVMEVENEVNDSREFLNTLKLDVLSHEIYVFTPKGMVLNLPKGATCVDFAYKVHSQIGNRCTGAKVNNKIVPLTTVLQTGYVIEILTSQSSKGPSRDWLKFVITPQARTKIKAFFKKELQGENIRTGKDMLEKEAKRRGYQLSDLTSNQQILDKMFFRYSLSSIEDMYASVGYGGLTTNQIMIKLIDAYKKEQALNKTLIPNQSIAPAEETATAKKPHSGILIEGFGDFVIKIAKCCHPVPGDTIIGYAARGTGVSVHRADCPNVRNMEKERIMKAKWATDDESKFVAHLKITAVDKSGLLNRIVALLAAQSISITMLEAHSKHKGDALIHLGIQIKSTEELDYIIKKINALDDVISVVRSN
ncbi:MAG: bifunctional (p)ppGpp synthetase/guanosine-3',5'-bis(diphosphate) 3'-pyrophosphohydrolase [Clostridia bacterium]|nr:bifunctional (p)ppGpp synthetase/guanosine-3',5'-bis(diphosphate) 3'-pyrophosphohydrolase [Clostridia bacterium]